MPTAGDKVIYKLLNIERSFDVVYLGGIWPYKAISINEFLLPLLQGGQVSYKLHGWGGWPNGICGGILPDDRVCSFFNSGKVGPCISEKHTRTYGIDIPERAFKVALCGVLAIHDAVPRLGSIIDGIVQADGAADYAEKCIHYSRPKHEDERRALVERQRNHILQNHTYHHRMSTLFSALGFEEEANRMIE
jgi:hypothetical protein